MLLEAVVAGGDRRRGCAGGAGLRHGRAGTCSRGGRRPWLNTCSARRDRRPLALVEYVMASAGTAWPRPHRLGGGVLFSYLLFSYYYLGRAISRGWLLELHPDLRLAFPNTLLLLASSAAAWWGERAR